MLFEITPTAPYDFDLTVGSMTFFQARHAADMFEDGVLRRVLSLGDKPALVSVRSVGSVEAPRAGGRNKRRQPDAGPHR